MNSEGFDVHDTQIPRGGRLISKVIAFITNLKELDNQMRIDAALHPTPQGGREGRPQKSLFFQWILKDSTTTTTYAHRLGGPNSKIMNFIMNLKGWDDQMRIDDDPAPPPTPQERGGARN